MERLDHDEELLTTGVFLEVRSPSLENICGVWQQYAIVFGFGLLDDLEELGRDLGIGRHTFVGRAAKDQEHVPALFFFNLCTLLAFVTSGCCCLWWENTLIKSVSAAIKDADDKAVVEVSQGSESCLKVV